MPRVDDYLQELLGLEPGEDMTRNEVVKQLWTYIKANDLQDPANRRKIIVDAKLATVFTSPLDMFTMNKQLSKHVKMARDLVDSADEPAPKKSKAKPKVEKPKPKAEAKLKAEASKEPKAAKKPKAAKPKADADGTEKVSNPQKPQKLSPALQEIVKRETATRGEVMKAVWAYGKEKSLQDPENLKKILPSQDPMLHALMPDAPAEGVTSFTIMTFLKAHVLGPA